MSYPENFNSNAADAFWGTDSDATTLSELTEWRNATAKRIAAETKAAFEKQFPNEAYDSDCFDADVIGDMLSDAMSDAYREAGARS